MIRRLLVLLLNAAVVLTVVGGACPARAGCMMGRAQYGDCCAGAKSGMSAPRCCGGIQQIGRAGVAAAAERPVHEGRASLSVGGVAMAVAASPVRPAAFTFRHDGAAGPPGRTLIAQHTSLLL